MCLLLWLALLLTLGCGSELRRYPVTGKVTYQGKPVASGTITFVAVDGPASVAQLAADGTYALEAVPGEHRVTIEAVRVEGEQAAPKSFEEEISGAAQPAAAAPPHTVWLAPEKYARRDESPLAATVQPSATTVDFELE